ncbi:MAG: putative chromosome segregation and condensation protein [Planctomycetota bacterium]|jgi:segregation and condensation protein B
MDDISRELPIDTTFTGDGDPARGIRRDEVRAEELRGESRSEGKGPSEWLAHERGAIAEDLVVSETPRYLPKAEQVSGDLVAPDAAAQSESVESVESLDSVEPLQAAEPVEAPLPVADELDLDAMRAAAAADETLTELEEEYVPEDEEDGLPPVPEQTDAREVAKCVYVLMMTSREGLSLLRLAQAINTTQKLVDEALGLLQTQFRELGMPVELSRTGDTVKWLSAPSSFVYLQRLRGVKKLEKLSPAALETLAVIAYRQPVMRSEIEAIRGVKAGPMLRTLLQHKLVKVTGRADVPGRPLQYGTTPLFLERFGIASLQELPSVKEWKNLG